MNNLQILEQIKGEYNPKTAFGNKILISLIDSIVEPNSKGEFEINAHAEEPKVCVYWDCPNCGRYYEEDFGEYEIDYNKKISRNCSCGKKHKLTLI